MTDIMQLRPQPITSGELEMNKHGKTHNNIKYIGDGSLWWEMKMLKESKQHIIA